MLLSAALSTPISVETTTPTLPAPPETLQLVFLLQWNCWDKKADFLLLFVFNLFLCLFKEEIDEKESLLWYVQYHRQQGLKQN